jgi:hypothetical protein
MFLNPSIHFATAYFETGDGTVAQGALAQVKQEIPVDDRYPSIGKSLRARVMALPDN